MNKPDTSAHFITFFDGDEDVVGRIEGNGLGGVAFVSGGADFAELMPILNPQEVPQAGDVVRLYDGKISLKTHGAQQAMVVTGQPIIVGNASEASKGYPKVSFLGQVAVKVVGPVQAGDWLIPSGLENGTALAVSPDRVKLQDLIIGRALESKDDNGDYTINTLIGFDHCTAYQSLILSLQDQLAFQQKQLKALTDMVIDLKKEIRSSLPRMVPGSDNE